MSRCVVLWLWFVCLLLSLFYRYTTNRNQCYLLCSAYKWMFVFLQLLILFCFDCDIFYCYTTTRKQCYLWWSACKLMCFWMADFVLGDWLCCDLILMVLFFVFVFRFCTTRRRQCFWWVISFDKSELCCKEILSSLKAGNREEILNSFKAGNRMETTHTVVVPTLEKPCNKVDESELR